MQIFSNVSWHDADGNECEDEIVEQEVENYTSLGGKIFIGVDSMFRSGKCSFVSVIAFHDKKLKIAKYFYKRLKRTSSIYSDLQTKIFEEVNMSLQLAEYVRQLCPKAKIELHVDIGKKQTCATKKFYSLVKGWVKGSGLNLKLNHIRGLHHLLPTGTPNRRLKWQSQLKNVQQKYQSST